MSSPVNKLKAVTLTQKIQFASPDGEKSEEWWRYVIETIVPLLHCYNVYSGDKCFSGYAK